jgi:hypothetical protein
VEYLEKWRRDVPKNIGSVDRIVRLVLAAVVAVLYFTGVISGVSAIILGLLAVVLLATSLLGFCPLYLLFRFSTNKARQLHTTG